MTWVDVVYATTALGDAAVLFFWGLIDLKAKHFRDGAFLLILGLCGFTAYGLGQLKDRELNAVISAEALKQKEVEANNLTLASVIEGERQQRLVAEKALEDFRHVSELSDEAVAGSDRAFGELKQLSRGKDAVGKRALERVNYIKKELAYYDQPPGIVLAL